MSQTTNNNLECPYCGATTEMYPLTFSKIVKDQSGIPLYCHNPMCHGGINHNSDQKMTEKNNDQMI